jgi:hypothetical protein
LIGLDSIFGAFLFGLAIPRGSRLYRECREYIEEFVLTFTLPLYFTLSGLKTDVATIKTGAEGAMVILVCFCATAGKFVGAGVSAYFSGCTIRESSTIAVLMNTRGLVELIVLNVGLQAGILNTRTFSVMVIMCLFTTFITYPLVSVVYPEQIRMKADVVTGKEEEEAIGESVKSEVELDRDISFAIARRLGVVVVSRSQMQSIVDVLSYFLPHRLGSEFSVTAMHFIEPTKTKEDEFLGLNHEGRLIRVDEETTDVSRAFQVMEDPAAKKPQLLPISAYCNAYHIPVNAFRVEGDACEFAKELKALTMKNECNLICIPFRPNSLFSMDFFWSSWRTVTVPLLLVMQVKAGSVSGSGRPGSVGPGTPHPPTPRLEPFSPIARFIPRSKSGHTFLSPALPHIDEEGPLTDASAPPALYTNQSPEVLPFHRRRSVTRNIRKMMTGQLRTNSIVILLTGAHSDLIILSSILGRFVENFLNQITVLLPKGYQADFSSAVVDSISSLQLQHEETSNLHWLDLNAAASDYKELYNECIHCDYDLFVCSFVEPNDRVTPHSNNRNHHNHRDAGSRTSGFFNASLVDMFMYHAVEEDPIELRIESGMPVQYAYSSLPYPELGIIGSKMYENAQSKSSLVLIVHEPFRKLYGRAAKTNSLSAAMPPTKPRAELRAVKSTGDVLHTHNFDEETKDSQSAKAILEMDSEV